MASVKSKKAVVAKKAIKKSAKNKAGKAKVIKKKKSVSPKDSRKAPVSKGKSSAKKVVKKAVKKSSPKQSAKKSITTTSKAKTPTKKNPDKLILRKSNQPAPSGLKGNKSIKTSSKKVAAVSSKTPSVKNSKQDKSEKKSKISAAPAPIKAVKKVIAVEGVPKKAILDKNAPDPLQIKAEKVIKELEETMDLSKLRPRLSAGTTSPKPLQKQPVQPIKLPEPTNTTKEKFQVEFEFRSSPKILFTSLSDSSGLAGWFADEVHTKDDVYTFVWEGGESLAKLVALRDLQLVRFQWLDDTDGTYFQFEIKEDDITSDIALLITDFANPGERETSIRLWESQVQKLRMLLGSL